MAILDFIETQLVERIPKFATHSIRGFKSFSLVGWPAGGQNQLGGASIDAIKRQGLRERIAAVGESQTASRIVRLGLRLHRSTTE